MSDLSPKDGKNYEVDSNPERYSVSSGDMDVIHGMSNYQLTTQESQLFGFYADTGQGKGGQGGPGTGKHVLNTPGMSMEVVGSGLKVRDEGDITDLPAKQIIAKKGNIHLKCENGDITLEARNINIKATGGGNKDGQLFMEGVRLVDIKGPDVKIQGEKFTCRATQECDIVTNGFMKMQSAFKIDANNASKDFGAMTEVLTKATTLNVPQVGEQLDAIAEKGKGFAEKVKGTTGKLEGIAEGLAENVDTGSLSNVQDTLSGLLGGLG